MRKIKEVLRLKFEVGLGLRQIARSCSIGLGTAHEYLQRAEAAEVTWPLGPEWDDDRLETALFGGPPRSRPTVCNVNRPHPCRSGAELSGTLSRVPERLRRGYTGIGGSSRYMACLSKVSVLALLMTIAVGAQIPEKRWAGAHEYDLATEIDSEADPHRQILLLQEWVGRVPKD